MSKLPRLSGRDCVKALSKAGFYQKRRHGSHIILRRDNPFAQLVVPDHKELDIARIHEGLAQARRDEFATDEEVKAFFARHAKPGA